MIATLGELCKIQSGGTPSRSNKACWSGGNIPWVKISDINSKYLDKTEEFITEQGLGKSSAKIFPKGTILFTIFATLGEVAILNIDAATNQAIAGIQIQNYSIKTEYLYYYLSSLKTIVDKLGRGVAQNNINMSILKSLKIQVPSLKEQDKIVKTLTCIEKLIRIEQDKISKLDMLIKSRFIELFGDPIKNTKSLQAFPGYKLFKLTNGKFVPKSKRFSDGIPAYGGNGIFCYTDNSLVESETIIVGRVGFQSGNVSKTAGPAWITDNAMYIRDLDSNKLDMHFLYYLMKFIDFTRFQDLGDLKKIKQEPFMRYSFICPEKSEQELFVRWVYQVDKSKSVVEWGGVA